jgi:Flp pilus assembly pilin Flp
MRKVQYVLRTLLIEDDGGEVLEYAIIAGLIVLAAIAAITAVGNSVMGKWTSLSNSM